ncbi:hypothetical protein FSP39_016186 [Pinctada imbricata]|uniref:Lipoma HMGIC fusion partner-like 2 protein n=1 Tax=Pinctada imbricata TaxID=66713 RepID=A0AA88Y9P1_PINIB|nr:hypothetical protein FSP39_016186 [Pinctada imbricata]
MCYVIITCRTLGWTLLSITITLLIVAAVVSPNWLIGMPIQIKLLSLANETVGDESMSDTFRPTVGIFNRCRKLQLNILSQKTRDNCATYVTSYDGPNDDFPHAWKASLVLFALAGLLLLVTMLFSVISLCVRSLCGKSIFTMSGLIQSIAGLLCVIGLVVYPVGWGTKRVRDLCGEYADPFIIGRCSLGWSFYLCIAGTVLIFVCSILSIQAEHSTSSRKVEEEVLEGKNLICVL